MSLMDKEKRKMVLVVWIDAECMEERWSDLDAVRDDLDAELQPCLTVGWLLEINEQRLTVTMTDGESSVGPYTTIPKGCIKSVSYLTATSQSENANE